MTAMRLATLDLPEVNAMLPTPVRATTSDDPEEILAFALAALQGGGRNGRLVDGILESLKARETGALGYLPDEQLLDRICPPSRMSLG
ncbi:hypothetical protein [Pararhizobium sp. PWRC1-1]|uniref:hypothetical protein n=1 Tax=Pararhizobium sp. PWRC1-1 TaxID=2804566 RepID=UPI003CE7FCC1